MAFVNLHQHTEYSLLDGYCRIEELVARAKELGMTSLAITDHGNMFGVIKFYRECKKQGIKPIIGCEIYVAPGSRFEREKGTNDERYYHLILLAENDTGYRNLVKIVSKSYTEGFYYKPRADRELLEQYHEGLICCSACLAGEVARYLQLNMYDKAKEAALWHEKVFGKGNYFLELQDHGYSVQQTVNAGIMRLSKETGIEMVCTNDVHYVLPEDAVPHDYLLCIQTAKKFDDEDRMRYEGGQFYLKSEQEMRALFPYALQAVDNTEKIAQRCNVEIEFGNYKLPKYPLPEGETDASHYLRALCEKGLSEKYAVMDGQKERLDYELSVIESMGFVDYFLIVWDFINFAKTHDIPVGPGRGSAAGSLVAYCLGITDIEPTGYALIFERFLNPERVTMPDIDVDICYVRRREVIDYVTRKYGKDHVSQIVTFGTLAARGVIKDVGRVMDLPYALCDTISKMIPARDPENANSQISIERAFVLNPELKEKYDSDEDVKKLIDIAKKLEGLPRHTSVHAAGVVISPRPVDEYVPLSADAEGVVTTQYTMTVLEELGLLKMDFLGLRTLTVIHDAIKLIEKNRGIKLDIRKIDMNDARVYASIGTGHTEGVFQLESSGMMNFMKELKPGNIEDVIAGIALYRPGPMDFIPKYLAGKNDATSVTYDCPQLRPILEPTYGCIVYQEQVMQIVRDLAGYTMGRSDMVRRAMSKKKTSVMEKERQNFVYGNAEEGVAGCIANGISEEVANRIYDEMTDFAKYAFNKSHAAAYAVVAYQTAYLKYHYKAEFMAALMTSFLDRIEKVTYYVRLCKKMGINVIAPDINLCETGFSVSGDSIVYGLASIKSVGQAVINTIVDEREIGGRYTSLADFIDRVCTKNVSRKVVECLIKAGAFDSFEGTRREKLMVYSQLMDEAAKRSKNSMAGQMSFFDMMSPQQRQEYAIQMPKAGEFDKKTLLEYEREVLGFYMSGHPLEEYQPLIDRFANACAADFALDEETGETGVVDGKSVTVGGIVTAVRTKITRSNKPMAFVTIEDMTGSVEALVFPATWEKIDKKPYEGSRVFINGRVSTEETGAKLLAQSLFYFDDAPRQVWVRFNTPADYSAASGRLLGILRRFPGKDTACVYIRDPRSFKKLDSLGVRSCPELIEALGRAFGAENISEKTVNF